MANYNTALRKAAEHEPITRNRANNSSVIACPQLSVLLTGTFSQYKALVPSIENGYFSRLLTLIVNDQQAFNHQYVEPGRGSNGVMRVAAEQLYGLYEQLYFAKPVEFRLSDEQRSRLGQHLENAYPMLMRLLGANFHSVVLRMAVQIERMAMILTALRIQSTDRFQVDLRIQTGLHCSDEDYRTAEMIGNKLMLHMAVAYKMIKGVEEEAVPQVQVLDQRQMLLSLLPAEYTVQNLVTEAKSQGLSYRTATRWNEEWQGKGLVQKIRHGVYRKRLASA